MVGIAKLSAGGALGAALLLRRPCCLRRDRKRLAIGPACLVGERTAILGQKINDGLHALEFSAVVQVTAFASTCDEANVDQLPQVKG